MDVNEVLLIGTIAVMLLATVLLMMLKAALRSIAQPIDLAAFRPGAKGSWNAEIGDLLLILNHEPGKPGQDGHASLFRSPMTKAAHNLALTHAVDGKYCVDDLLHFGGVRPTFDSYPDAYNAFMAVAAKFAQHPVLARLRYFRREVFAEVQLFYMVRKLGILNMGTAPWMPDFKAPGTKT